MATRAKFASISPAAPAGFTVTSPLVIEAGQERAWGVIHAAADAQAPSKENASLTKAVATATIGGRTITKNLGALGEIKLAGKPKLLVRLELDTPELTAVENNATPRATEPGDASNAESTEPSTVVIAPGTTVTARLVIERNGFVGEVKFDVDNLPHGVIVDNIGLSGILITAERSERQLFLSARDWVPEQTRAFQAVAQAEGGQASLPMRLKVQRSK